jgi:uncharacterized damage-inducible protein DinB
MTSKEIILEQMASCHDKKNWFVPLKDALAGLTAEQAKQSIGSDNHSVWQIVNHLIFWNERWLIRFKGDVPPKMEGDNSGTFSGDPGGETEWQISLQKLNNVLSELEGRLKDTDDSVLKQEAFKGYEATWYEMFTQMTIHNAYHIGQIVTLRKQQGSWNPDQGVQ